MSNLNYIVYWLCVHIMPDCINEIILPYKIPTTKFNKNMKEWCEHQNMCIIERKQKSYIIHFLLKDDAIHFKLVWS